MSGPISVSPKIGRLVPSVGATALLLSAALSLGSTLLPSDLSTQNATNAQAVAAVCTKQCQSALLSLKVQDPLQHLLTNPEQIAQLRSAAPAPMLSKSSGKTAEDGAMQPLYEQVAKRLQIQTTLLSMQVPYMQAQPDAQEIGWLEHIHSSAKKAIDNPKSMQDLNTTLWESHTQWSKDLASQRESSRTPQTERKEAFLKHFQEVLLATERTPLSLNAKQKKVLQEIINPSPEAAATIPQEIAQKMQQTVQKLSTPGAIPALVGSVQQSALALGKKVKESLQNAPAQASSFLYQTSQKIVTGALVDDSWSALKANTLAAGSYVGGALLGEKFVNFSAQTLAHEYGFNAVHLPKMQHQSAADRAALIAHNYVALGRSASDLGVDPKNMGLSGTYSLHLSDPSFLKMQSAGAYVYPTLNILTLDNAQGIQNKNTINHEYVHMVDAKLGQDLTSLLEWGYFDTSDNPNEQKIQAHWSSLSEEQRNEYTSQPMFSRLPAYYQQLNPTAYEGFWRMYGSMQDPYLAQKLQQQQVPVLTGEHLAQYFSQQHLTGSVASTPSVLRSAPKFDRHKDTVFSSWQHTVQSVALDALQDLNAKGAAMSIPSEGSALQKQVQQQGLSSLLQWKNMSLDEQLNAVFKDPAMQRKIVEHTDVLTQSLESQIGPLNATQKSQLVQSLQDQARHSVHLNLTQEESRWRSKAQENLMQKDAPWKQNATLHPLNPNNEFALNSGMRDKVDQIMQMQPVGYSNYWTTPHEMIARAVARADQVQDLINAPANDHLLKASSPDLTQEQQQQVRKGFSQMAKAANISLEKMHSDVDIQEARWLTVTDSLKQMTSWVKTSSTIGATIATHQATQSAQQVAKIPQDLLDSAKQGTKNLVSYGTQALQSVKETIYLTAQHTLTPTAPPAHTPDAIATPYTSTSLLGKLLARRNAESSASLDIDQSATVQPLMDNLRRRRERQHELLPAPKEPKTLSF